MSKRTGFTLYQLIILILVLSVVFGLVVPGVLMLREADRLTWVNNFMKQMGVAAHMYNDQFKQLPPAHDGTGSTHAILRPYLNTSILINGADESAPSAQDDKLPWTSIAINYYLVGTHNDATTDITASPSFTGLPAPEAGKANHGYTPLAIKGIGDGSSNTIMWTCCLSRPAGRNVVILGDGSFPNSATGPFTAWLFWEVAPAVERAMCASGKHAQSFRPAGIIVGLADGGARSIATGSKIYADAMLPNDKVTPRWDY